MYRVEREQMPVARQREWSGEREPRARPVRNDKEGEPVTPTTGVKTTPRARGVSGLGAEANRARPKWAQCPRHQVPHGTTRRTVRHSPLRDTTHAGPSSLWSTPASGIRHPCVSPHAETTSSARTSSRTSKSTPTRRTRVWRTVQKGIARCCSSCTCFKPEGRETSNSRVFCITIFVIVTGRCYRSRWKFSWNTRVSSGALFRAHCKNKKEETENEEDQCVWSVLRQSKERQLRWS